MKYWQKGIGQMNRNNIIKTQLLTSNHHLHWILCLHQIWHFAKSQCGAYTMSNHIAFSADSYWLCIICRDYAMSMCVYNIHVLCILTFNFLFGFANFNSMRATLREAHVHVLVLLNRCIIVVAIAALTDTSFFHLLLFPNFLFAPLCPYIIFIVRTVLYECILYFARIARQGTARLPIDKFIYTLWICK